MPQAVKDYGLYPGYVGNNNKFIVAFNAWQTQFVNLKGATTMRFMQTTAKKYYMAQATSSAETFCDAGVGQANTDYSSPFHEASYYYSGIFPDQRKTIAFINVKSLSEMAITSGSFYSVIQDVDYCKIGASLGGYVDFLAANGSKKIITGVTFYDNTNDGSISSSSKRTAIGQVNVSTPSYDLFLRQSAPLYTNGTNYTESGNLDMLIPIFRAFLMSGKAQGASNYGNLYQMPVGMRNNFPDITPVYHFLNAQTVGNVVTVIDSQQGGWYALFTDLAAITNTLNHMGIPWTYTQAEAEGANSNNFPDWKPAGQGTDSTGGGNGNGDNASDDITEQVPDVSVISTFNKHWACSGSQLQALSTYLWTSTFVNDIKLLFSDPMESVVSCKLFPFSLPGHDSAHVGGSTPIVLGNVTTTAEAYPVGSNYNCKFDLGSFDVAEYYGTAMDYEPYTKIQIYLPYIGIKDLSTNEVMGHTLSIDYNVDITTGTCIAEIWADSKLLYTYDGKIGVEIPINSTNAAQYAAGLAMTGITAAAGIGIGAATGNPLAVAGTVLATAKSVAGNQFHVSKGGANSPFGSFYMPQYCYLIINRPIQSLASTFGATYGFPCNISKTLSALKGFTQVDEVHLSGINATRDELDEIYTLLKQGVIIA